MLLYNLINSSNFLFSAASCKAPGKRDAPKRPTFGGETAINSYNDWDLRGIIDKISLHLMMLRYNPRLGPLRLIIVTSSLIVDMFPPNMISSIYPTTSSQRSRCKRGCMVMQNNSAPKRSPCCVSSSDKIYLDPHLSLLYWLYDRLQNL